MRCVVCDLDGDDDGDDKKVAVLLMIMFRRCFSDEGQDLGEMDLSSVTKLLLSNVPV